MCVWIVCSLYPLSSIILAESGGLILGSDNKIILVYTLLSSRSHNGFLTFYVTSAYLISGLISPACPVVAVLKSDHHK